MKKFGIAAFAAAALAATTLAAPVAHACDVKRPIVFGDLDWDSNAFHTAVARFVLEKGYGCKTDSIPGSTIPIDGGAVRGDVDVVMEIWLNTAPKVWTDGVKAGKVEELGVNFPDAVQAWYVPKYLVEGPNAPAPGLKSVSDLPKYKALFKDPEEPSKGRFYNCILGWTCEVINTKKLHAYGLEKDFTNFRPGTGAALSAAIESAVKRKKPIVFYYWTPTWLFGKVGDDVVQLKEPAYNKATWDKLIAAKHAGEVDKATAYPLTKVYVGVNSKFAKEAPAEIAFLKNYHTNSALVSKALAYMQDHDGSAKQAAIHFLKTRKDLWTKWVPADVAKKIEAAL